MDQALTDVFEQARKIVAEADRKIAEEEERRRELERETLLLQLASRIEEAFDFTSKEKLELEPRLEVQDGTAVVEFVVRSLRAIFLLLPVENNMWTLLVIEDGRKPELLIEFQGGAKTEPTSRRLSAARLVTAIGNWALSLKGPQTISNSNAKRSRGTQESDEPKATLTYGTMGKFLGY
jgi:hypothetical protein